VATQGYTPGYQPRNMWLLSPVSTLVDSHPGLKRLICLLCFRVLLVQPYDIMGSVLIEYDVRVQLVSLKSGGIWERVLLVWLITPSERSRLILLFG
jgi:hypothetical protein